MSRTPDAQLYTRMGFFIYISCQPSLLLADRDRYLWVHLCVFVYVLGQVLLCLYKYL